MDMGIVNPGMLQVSFLAVNLWDIMKHVSLPVLRHMTLFLRVSYTTLLTCPAPQIYDDIPKDLLELVEDAVLFRRPGECTHGYPMLPMLSHALLYRLL